METNELHEFGINDEQEVSKCGLCEKTFASLRGLQQHIGIHSEFKPYQCDVCAKRFKFKSNMYEHRSIHTGFHPHKCPFCDKTFRLKGNMKKHMRTHVSSNEELEQVFRPFAHNNRSHYSPPPPPPPEPPKFADQHEIKPRTSRSLKLGRNSTKWIEMLIRNELLPISTIEEKLEHVKDLVVFNGEEENNVDTLFEDCKSIEFEIYNCPFCKTKCRGKLACDSHIRKTHAKIRENDEWFCDTCVRHFTSENIYLQHQSYHTRIQLMLQNNHVKAFDNPTVSIDQIAYHRLDFSNNNHQEI